MADKSSSWRALAAIVVLEQVVINCDGVQLEDKDNRGKGFIKVHDTRTLSINKVQHWQMVHDHSSIINLGFSGIHDTIWSCN